MFCSQFEIDRLAFPQNNTVLISITLYKVTSLSGYGSYLAIAGIIDLCSKTPNELLDALLGYLDVFSKKY